MDEKSLFEREKSPFPSVSEEINFGKYFGEFKNIVGATSNEHVLKSLNTDEEKIASQLGIDMDEYHDLERRCSISLLLSEPLEDAQKKPTDKEMLDEAAKYLSTAAELKALKSCPKEYSKKLTWLRKNAFPVFEQEEASAVPMSPETFLVVVRVQSKIFDGNKHLNLVPHQDIMLCGSQNLTKLKDAIKCVNKEKEVVGTEDSPDKSEFSAFFFGSVTYVNDLALTENYFSGAVVKSMDSLIEELDILLGFPYVFMHSDKCEHAITFLQARLMTPEDVQNPDRYPLEAILDTSIKDMVVRVGNIGFDTTKTHIGNVLRTIGAISWISVNVLKDNPKEKAALVKFFDEKHAYEAVSLMNGYEVKGRHWSITHVDQTSYWDEFVLEKPCPNTTN